MATFCLPPLRADLKVRKLILQKEVCYIVKEPDSGSYYRFDEPRYLMLALFDGIRDATQLLAIFNQTYHEYEFEREALDELIQTARSLQLLKRTRKEENTALLEKIAEQRKGILRQAKGSWLYMRFHLFDPDRLLNRWVGSLRILWTPGFVYASIILIAMSAFLLVLNADRFFTELKSLFFIEHGAGGLGFGLIWLVTLMAIALHEFAHGLTCKHFGGDVNDMGILLMVMQPCLYCNVNDAWLFEERRHKIYVALAGVWAELTIGALAVLVWLLVEPQHMVGKVALILIAISTTSSLFLNLNPLMKYDGYYILSDWLEIPNLRQDAIKWFSHRSKEKIFAIKEDVALQPNRYERRVYFIYGGLVVVYLTLVLTGLGVLGYSLVAATVGSWGIVVYLVWAMSMARKMVGGWLQTASQLLQLYLWGNSVRRGLTVIGGIGMLILLIYWRFPMSVVVDGKVEAVNYPMHAPIAGFVEEVRYQNDRSLIGQEGELLFLLRSPELALALEKLEVKKNVLQLQIQGSISAGERGKSRTLVTEMVAVEENLAFMRARMAQRKVVIPPGRWLVDGVAPVILLGRYFHVGELVLNLVPDDRRQMTVEVEEADLTYIREGQDVVVNLVGSGENIVPGRVLRVAPVSRVEGKTQRFFPVRIDLLLDQSLPIPTIGMSARVRIAGESRGLWEHLMRPIRKIFRLELWY